MSVTRIEKTSGSAPRMSRCVIKGDMVYVAGLTASDRSADIKGQTQQILDKIDDYLSQAGTDKSKLLQANLWITDMANFSSMNEIWNDLIKKKELIGVTSEKKFFHINNYRIYKKLNKKKVIG